MKVLLADDAEVVRLVIGRFVQSLGHELIVATDGVQAVELCLSEQPDMVLMDMLMPHLDGPEAGRQIKANMSERWIPVVLITAVEEVAKLADAMELGADDYLLKPVNFRILEAKIKAIERTVQLNRKVREQARRLVDYYDRAEEEKLVARQLMEQLVSRERLSDTQLHTWISPAESLSGDLIAAARTPGRVLHLILADGIGHGLTAALNVLPLTQPFYAMTERGFAPADILVEMHRKVREVLPTGRFVALAFVAVDFSRSTVEVWNGGIPDLQLFAGDGELLKRWSSRHLPVGVLPVGKLDLAFERYSFSQTGKLVMCSDGLLEARNSQGEAFGVARLNLACAAQPAAEAVKGTIAALTEFLAGAACHDDVSLAIVDLVPMMSTVHQAPRNADIDGLLRTRPVWRYALSLGPDQLRSLRTVPLVMSFIGQIPSLDDAHEDVFAILAELFGNALDHGVLHLPAALRSSPDGADLYRAERTRRLRQLTEGQIDIALTAYQSEGRFLLCIKIEDSGKGFDISQLQESAGTQDRFQGIRAVQSLCTSLRYLGCGNTVEACYLASSAS